MCCSMLSNSPVPHQQVRSRIDNLKKKTLRYLLIRFFLSAKLLLIGNAFREMKKIKKD